MEHMKWSLTLAVSKADSQSLSLRVTLRDIGHSVPDPAAVRTNVAGDLEVGGDYGNVSTKCSKSVTPANWSGGRTYCSGWRRP